MVEASSRQPTGVEVTSEVAPAGRISQSRYAILLVGLTLLVCVAAMVFIQPRVGPWLEMRSAYRNLSSSDYDTRIDAISHLRSVGEDAEPELISLLHHADERVRDFAAGQLANGTPATQDSIEAFLVALENDRHVAEIGGGAPKLFFRHAKNATGPLTQTDRRMIAWLRREQNSTDPEQSGSAAWALTAFTNRDPSLRAPLVAYLKNATFFHQYVVLREMTSSDPSLRDQYVDVLLSGLASSVPADQLNALYGLKNWKNGPNDLRSRLETDREESTDPGEISRIEQALKAIGVQDPDQP